MTFQATQSAHSTVAGKKRLARGGKPALRFKVGDDLWRKLDRWVHRELYADREHNRYRERVIDPETGQVIHECDEPLDKHQGHGDAKTRKS
jgi:hypothetical protein